MVGFLSFLLWIPGKIDLIWTADWDWEHNSLDSQNILIILLSAIAVMQVIFWTEENIYVISDCRDSFNCKLKKLINEQIIIFYSPSKALYSSEESVQLNILRIIISLFSAPFPLGLTASTEFLLMKTHRDLAEKQVFL